MSRKILLILLVTMLSSANVLAMGAGKHQHMKAMMHANPLPNYMQIINRQADLLDLNEQQTTELAKWREKSHQPMKVMVAKVAELEKAMLKASLSEESAEQILDLLEKSLDVRREIASGKTRCRDNMRKILSAEQWAQVVALYEAKL